MSTFFGRNRRPYIRDALHGVVPKGITLEIKLFCMQFGDVFLISLTHLPNSIQNSSISRVQHFVVTLDTVQDDTSPGEPWMG